MPEKTPQFVENDVVRWSSTPPDARTLKTLRQLHGDGPFIIVRVSPSNSHRHPQTVHVRSGKEELKDGFNGSWFELDTYLTKSRT